MFSQQNFQSKEEPEVFMQNLVGKSIPAFGEELSDADKAEDMVYEVCELELSDVKAKKNAKKALALDSDCILAYELLASLELDFQKSMDLYKRGVDIGRCIFGGKYLRENKGHFWGMHETRPFMRCMFKYSQCLYQLEEKNKTIDIQEELAELNSNDNQGNRYYLLLYLIEAEAYEKYIKYAKGYKWDDGAFSLFNAVLFSYKTKENTQVTRNKLQKAMEYNPFVVKRLLSVRKVNYYQPRQDGEAQSIWKKTPGILEWFKEQQGKDIPDEKMKIKCVIF